MKKVFLFLALMATLNGYSQKINSYKDSTFTQPYTVLNGATSLNNGLFWDDEDFVIPIGFTFKYFGDSSNTLYHSADFGSGGQFTLKPFSPNNPFLSFITMIGSDLRDRDLTNSGSSVSPISYQTTGTAPNRIFKLQFSNAGFGTAIANSNTDDSLSIQLWLYETSNMIDIRFGPSHMISSNNDLWDGGPGPFIALIDSLNYFSSTFSVKKCYFLNGTVNAPVIDSSLTALGTLVSLPGMAGKPSNGRVYRFMPRKLTGTATGIKDVASDEDLRIQYDQAREEVVFYSSVNEAKMDIYDLNGRPVFTTNAKDHYVRYSTGSLSSGLYIARSVSSKGQKVYKFVK